MPKTMRGQPHITTRQQEMQIQMMKLVAGDIDVAEVCSPHGVANRAGQLGFTGGWGLALTTEDSDGRAWDVLPSRMRKRAVETINKDTPLLIAGGPTRTAWAQ